jgi:triosephosphate isomerase
VKSALAHALKPIMCVGETLEQRQANETSDVLVRQTRGGLDGVTLGPEFALAYEPVWAIGTGLAADGAIAEEAISLIRSTIREIAGPVADSIRILYGGSVTPDNIAEFMAQPDVDGGLVGGASLKADVFSAIIENTAAGLA